MKKVLYFLVGLLLLALMLGWIVLSGAIYNTGNRLHQTPHFFSVNVLASNRVNEPKTLTELGDLTIRDMLIKKYVTEYFYVIPDTKNVEQRIKGKYANGNFTALYGMGPKAFEQWLANQSETIKKLAQDGVMRTVDVTNIENGDAGYLIVDYELKTWFTANDMNEVPTITRGRLYIYAQYTPGVEESFTNLNRLENGYDAASVFHFAVGSVIQE